MRNRIDRGMESFAEGKRTLLIVSVGSLCLAAAFIAATLLLSSCSARIGSAIGADGGARFTISAELPAPLAAKFRKLAAMGGTPGAEGPFFDAGAIRKSLAARPGVSLISLSQPTPDSIRVEATARSLEELSSAPDIKDSKLISFSRGQGWAEFRIRIERGGAKAASALFSGIDPYILDALSPPALEEDPVSPAEYRTMLKGVLGERAMAGMEAAAIALTISAPGPVIASGGGSLSGSTLSAAIPVIDALVLEKPIELWLRWKD